MIQSEMDLWLRACTSFPSNSLLSGFPDFRELNYRRKIYYARSNEARMCDDSAECTARRCGLQYLYIRFVLSQSCLCESLGTPESLRIPWDKSHDCVESTKAYGKSNLNDEENAITGLWTESSPKKIILRRDYPLTIPNATSRHFHSTVNVKISIILPSKVESTGYPWDFHNAAYIRASRFDARMHLARHININLICRYISQKYRYLTKFKKNMKNNVLRHILRITMCENICTKKWWVFFSLPQKIKH